MQNFVRSDSKQIFTKPEIFTKKKSPFIPRATTAHATLVAILLLRSVVSAAQVAPVAVTCQATLNDVKYVYGVAPPVARLKAGDVIDTNTLDAFGDALQKPGDSLSLVKGDNPLTGPLSPS